MTYHFPHECLVIYVTQQWKWHSFLLSCNWIELVGWLVDWSLTYPFVIYMDILAADSNLEPWDNHLLFLYTPRGRNNLIQFGYSLLHLNSKIKSIIICTMQACQRMVKLSGVCLVGDGSAEPILLFWSLWSLMCLALEPIFSYLIVYTRLIEQSNIFAELYDRCLFVCLLL